MYDKTMQEYFYKFGQRVEIKKDEMIYNPNNIYARSCAHFLDSGIAALTCTTRDGEEKVYLYFSEKNLIGFTQLMVKDAYVSEEQNGDRNGFYITAKTDCILYRILESDFHSLLEENLEFNRSIIRVLTRNYVEVLNRFHQAQEDNTTVRFCRWLLQCAIEQNGKKVIPKNFTYVEVAKYLGTHSVTVSRIAARLKAKGCIAKEDHYIVLKDEDMIRQIIQEETSVGNQ